MKLPRNVLIAALLSSSLLLFQHAVHSGILDSAGLVPSNSVILTGTLQPLTFTATNDKAFAIKTYHAELAFTAGLTITDIVTTPSATTATIDTRKNLLILEWSAVAPGTALTATVNVSSYAQGTYTISPSSIYYADYNRKTYTASCNSSTISIRYELVAPASPRNIRSLSGDGFIRIYWDRPGDPDVAGYRIYRRTAATDFVNLGNVTTSPYIDATAIDGATYYYRVAAVDGSGNESEWSAETSETHVKLLARTFSVPGISIAAAGDVNGDGKPDLVLGYPTYDAGKGGNVIYDAGKVEIYYGGNTTGIPDVTLIGENAKDQFGYALAVVDMNKDGHDEFIVGAPFFDAHVFWPYDGTATDAGRIYVYTGGPSLNSTPVFTWDGDVSLGCGGGCYYMFASENLGMSIVSAGDVNNDGYQDVVIGAPLGGVDRSGSIRVLFGGPNLSFPGGLKITGQTMSDYMGYSVASAGDVNGDGYADIIAGGGGGSIGKAFLVFGGNPLTVALKLRTGIENDGFGRVVSSTGDINGDGFSDFIVNRNIYYGSPSADKIADRIIPDTPDFLSPLGDLNRDGFGDFLVSPGPRAYLGGADGENVADILREGMKILATADIDRDGTREILIGADANAVYVYSLAPLVTANLPNIVISTPKNNLVTDLSFVTVNGAVRGTITKLQVGGQYIPLQPDGTFTASASLAEGTNVIEINAETPQGNISKRWLTIKRARPAPLTLSITSPANGTVYNSEAPIMVSGTVSDAAATVVINGIPANLYSSVSGNYFGTADVSLSEGPNTITAVARDDFGQTANQTITVTLLTKGMIAGAVTDTVTALALPGVAVTVQDSQSTHATTTDAQGAYTLPGIAAGGFTITFTKSGYFTQTSSGTISDGQAQTVNAQMTPQPPLTVSITSPQNGAVFHTSAITVTGTVTNNASVTVNGVPATVSSGAFTATLTLPDGERTITATATDQYGQTKSAGVTVTIVTKGTLSGTVTDSGTGSPLALATVTVSDSQLATHTAVTDATGNYTITGITQGDYSGTITAQDYTTHSFSGALAAGQTATVNAVLTLQPPSLSAITATAITTDSVIITWTTGQPTSSLVEYGTTTTYGSTITEAALTASHRITLTGLMPGTTYHYRVTAVNSHNLSTASTDAAFITICPPAISNVTITDITTTAAAVSWTTDQPSTSLVEYGTTTAYGSTASDAAMTTSHRITLTNLNRQAAYHFRVTSTNSDNLTSSSPDGAFSTLSPIAVTITSPADGATVQRPDIMVKGTITNTTGTETGITVNGIVANVHGNDFTANHVPLTEGTNTITVKATDTAGYTATASITLTTAITGNYITILSNIDSGIPALEPTLRVDGYADGTTPSISYLGPGAVDWTDCTSYEACRVKMTTEGIYYFTATGTGADGNEYQDTVAITVLSRTEMDALLKAKWEGMKAKLASQDVEGAVGYFVPRAQERYREILNLIRDQLPQTVQDMQNIEFIYLKNNTAKYRIRKQEQYGGQVLNVTYYLYFTIDSGGIWRIAVL